MKLSQTAYQKFIESLHDGRISMGGNYTQSEICDILGVSVTPLQHALRILENEGFVTIRARSGITVQQPSLNMYRECHQLRQILELAAIPYYVESVSDAEIQSLMDRINRHARKNYNDASVKETLDEQKAIEVQLHRGIIDSLQSETISKIYNTNWERTYLIRQWPGKLTAAYSQKTADEHLQFLLAVQDRDADAAAAALRQHLLLSLERGIMTNMLK